MNKTDLVGRYFKIASVYKIDSYEPNGDFYRIAWCDERQNYTPSQKTSVEYSYDALKDYFGTKLFEWCHGQSLSYGNVVTYDDSPFDKIDQASTSSSTVSSNGWFTSLNQTQTNPISQNEIDQAFTSSKQTQVNLVACECGAHKIGVKDYQVGHSSWCPMRCKNV